MYRKTCGVRPFFSLCFCFFVCALLPAHADPAAPNIKGVPQIFMEEHKGWEELYYRTFEIAFDKIQRGTPENGFVDFYMDEAFNPNIFQWDTSFIMMFARYGNSELPGIVSLDNFYRYQHDDGWIGRELREEDGSSYWPKVGGLDANCSINPPLFSWAEWQSYEVKGDKSRFTKKINGKPIFDILVDYYDWIKLNRRWDNGLYWTTSYANGMDRSPRLGTKHVCEHGEGGWIDITAQQALNALYIAKIADAIGETEVGDRFRLEHKEIAQLINRTLWDDDDHFYYDVDKKGRFYKVKTPASFWPFIARVASDEQAKQLVDEHILNPNRFWTEHHLPTVAKDEKTYMKDGGYWDGAVWAPTTYQTIKGLEVYGYREEARRIAVNHIEHLYWVYKNTNTLYENYQPESVGPGVHARPDFVGWTGVGPIAALIENVMGIQVDASQDSVTWDLALAEAHGIKNLHFGDNIIGLSVEDRVTSASAAEITVTTNSPVNLHVIIDRKRYSQLIGQGTHVVQFGGAVQQVRTLSIMPDGFEGRDVDAGLASFQSFVLTDVEGGREHMSLAGVDVKVQHHGGQPKTPLIANLFRAEAGKPVGESLAQAAIASLDVDSFYSVVHIPLKYPKIQPQQEYAVVLSHNGVGGYQWLTGEYSAPSSVEQAAKSRGSKSSAHAAWLKVYLLP